MEAHTGFMAIDCRKGIAAGLTFRPLVETVRDTFAWHQTRVDHQWANTLTSEKEQAALHAWRTRES